MILEDDAAVAPNFFAQQSLGTLSQLAKENYWSLLKTGECETFSDDERPVANPSSHCAQPGDAELNQNYFQTYTELTSVTHNGREGGIPDAWDMRKQRSYCSHAYIIDGKISDVL